MNKYSLAFIDYLLFVVSGLLLLVVLFAAAFNIVIQKNKGNTVSPAEYIIEMEWSDNSKDDVDVWLANPNGVIAYYGDQDIGMMSLDRDDLGVNNDDVAFRKEVMTIRGIVPGTYTLNGVMYAKRDASPQRVKVTVRKLNPYIEVYQGEFTFEVTKQEHTFLNFTLDEDGNVVTQDNDQVSLYERMALE